MGSTSRSQQGQLSTSLLTLLTCRTPSQCAYQSIPFTNRTNYTNTRFHFMCDKGQGLWCWDKDYFAIADTLSPPLTEKTPSAKIEKSSRATRASLSQPGYASIDPSLGCLILHYFTLVINATSTFSCAWFDTNLFSVVVLSCIYPPD